MEVEDWEFNPSGIEDARERFAGEILKRRGQPGFRRKLLKIYGNRCEITGCEATEVLEACHIVPYLGPKTNHPSNMTVVVAPSLRRSDYASLEGMRLREPVNPSFAPAAAAFEERRRRAHAD